MGRVLVCDMKRSSPKQGYDFAAKAGYRRWVWNFLGGRSNSGELHTGDVLLMPSTEGCEISDEAIPRGFKTSQLHVVDQNPAIVATLQRKFPGLNTYGCLVDKACERISERGTKLIGANVDYCGQLSGKLLRSLKKVSDSSACEHALLFVNLLRGREEPYIGSLMKGYPARETNKAKAYFLSKANECWDCTEGIEPTEMDFWRVLALRNMTNRYWFQARAYVSVNGQSFLTIGFQPKHFQPEAVWEIEQLKTLAEFNNGDPGDPLPTTCEGETAQDYKHRLTAPQLVRLSLICQRMDVGDIHLIKTYIMRQGQQRVSV